MLFINYYKNYIHEIISKEYKVGIRYIFFFKFFLLLLFNDFNIFNILTIY